MRVALVSCVKSRRPEPAPARDLHTSPLFRAMRRYAESHADAWYILSAKHGLVEPAGAGPRARAAEARHQLRAQCRSPAYPWPILPWRTSRYRAIVAST